jgi:fatty-acyl-CoA synthase
VASAINAQMMLGLQQHQRHLIVMPLGLAAGQLLAPWYGYRGGTTVVSRFEPGEVLDAIERHGINTVLLAPTMLDLLMQEQRSKARDLSSLQVILYGAAPTPIDMLLDAISFFDCDFVQGYGSSESGALITTLSPADHRDHDGDEQLRRRLRSIGRESPSCWIRVVDDEGNEAPDGEMGEIVARSPMTMREYWGRPDLTNEVLKDGWIHLGDLGYRGDDGYFFVVDRKSEMIISGGFNISPYQVETTLREHPAVAAAAVVGRPDEHWGEAVHAVVVLTGAGAAKAAELIAFCRERIASYKKPSTIEFVDALPLNASGKVDRKTIKATVLSRAQPGGRSREQPGGRS